MSVTGYLALYATLMGWQQYNNLWNIACGTGLIYLPFIGIVLTATIGPFTSMGAKDAAQIAIRRMGVQIFSAFMIILFAAQPVMDLDPKVLHYDPLCQDSSQPATPGHTGTTYDNAFPVPTGVKVPILWYLVMAFSNGITHTASLGLPCSPINYRALHSQLNSAKIQDAQLKQEVNAFYTDCYVPTYSAYLSGKLTPAQQDAIKASLDKNGKDDIGWLGSETFLNIDGLYDTHQSKQVINGFAFDPSRDQEEGQVAGHSQWGNPDCKSWWSDPQNGLSSRLKQALPPSFMLKLSHIGGDQEQLQNAVVKTLITQSSSNNQSIADQARGYESLNDNVHGDFMSRFLGGPLGVAYESLNFYPKMHLLINALPVIQAALLFGLYAFLGLAVPFSSYRIAFCVAGTVVMFSLIFCSFLWNLTQWFDSYLIQALYPSAGDLAGMGGVLDINIGGGTNEIFVDMIIGTLYIVLPLLWMAVMSWAGFKAGAFMSGLFTAMALPAIEAGSKVGNVSGNMITKSIGKL